MSCYLRSNFVVFYHQPLHFPLSLHIIYSALTRKFVVARQVGVSLLLDDIPNRQYDLFQPLNPLYVNVGGCSVGLLMHTNFTIIYNFYLLQIIALHYDPRVESAIKEHSFLCTLLLIMLAAVTHSFLYGQI